MTLITAEDLDDAAKKAVEAISKWVDKSLDALYKYIWIWFSFFVGDTDVLALWFMHDIA